MTLLPERDRKLEEEKVLVVVDKLYFIMTLLITTIIIFISIFYNSTFCLAIPREQCQEVGFNANVLLCTTCASVSNIVIVFH